MQRGRKFNGLKSNGVKKRRFVFSCAKLSNNFNPLKAKKEMSFFKAANIVFFFFLSDLFSF